MQTAGELCHEGAHHGRIGPRHVRDHQDETLGVLFSRLHHLAGPFVGAIAIHSVACDAGAGASQVFDQCEANHDRDGPQLAELQGRDRLIGRDETAETFRVHPSVAMRDDFKRDVVDPGQAGRWTVAQPGQFAAIPFGQVPPGQANLFFDQVEVIEQPFSGRCDASTSLHRLGHQIPHIQQDGFILSQSSEQRVGLVLGTDGMQPREGLAMLLHLLGTEELRSQRQLITGIGHGRRLSAQASGQLTPACKNICAAHLQIRDSLRSRSRRWSAGYRQRTGPSRTVLANEGTEAGTRRP